MRKKLSNELRRKALVRNPTPSWLLELNADTPFDLRNVLSGSVYYPGCRFDFRILHAYLGFAHSFVYVDYATRKKDALNTLPKVFGYKIDFNKELDKSEIFKNETKQLPLRGYDFYPPVRIGESVIERSRQVNESQIADRFGEPNFYFWLVYSRMKNMNPGHGPERFSLLYITGEGVFTYKSIYNSNDLVPNAIVIDNAHAGNWTLFEQRDGIFERTVMKNNAGIPKYLFTDDCYDPYLKEENLRFTPRPYWRKYTKEVPNKSFHSIWTINDENIDHFEIKSRSESKSKSKKFAKWYNEQVIKIWDEHKIDHPYLPNILGSFNVDSPICFIGMNPSFNKPEIMKMMMNDSLFEGLSPEQLHRNSLEDRLKRINFIRRLENIARDDYPYFSQIRKFSNSLELGFESYSYLDLFLLRETKQENLKTKLINNPEFKMSQLSLFRNCLEKIKSKYIVVLNSTASKEICDYLNKKQHVSEFLYNDKVIFCAGMIGGQRAMDTFSCERLRSDIRRQVQNNHPH